MTGISGIVYPDVYHIQNQVDEMLKTQEPSSTPISMILGKTELGTSGSPLETDTEKNIVVGVSGEIHNLKELKDQLSKDGIHAKDATLEECLILGYQEWRADLFPKLKGAFVLFIFDQIEQRLYLVRDQIGIKRLFWFQDDTHFIFASSLKSMLASKLIKAVPSVQGVATYLYLGCNPLDLSIIQDVNKLPPGHILQLDFKGSLKITPYWSYYNCFSPQKRFAEENLKDALSDSLNHAIDARVKENEPIGLINNGTHGAAILASHLLNKTSKEYLHSFSLSYEGMKNPSNEQAELIAKELSIPHHTFMASRQSYLNDLIKIIWDFDEPIYCPTALADRSLIESISPITKTLFSPIGAHEQLAPTLHYANLKKKVIDQINISDFRYFINQNIVTPLLQIFYPSKALKYLKMTQTKPWHLVAIDRYARMNLAELTLASPKLAELFDPQAFLQKLDHISHLPSPLTTVLYYDMKTQIPDFHCLHFDTLTQSFGINWEAPFLDRDFVTLTASHFEKSLLRQHPKNLYLHELTPMKGELPYTHVKTLATLKKWIGTKQLKQAFQQLLHGTLVESGIITEPWLTEKIQAFPQDKVAFRQLWLLLTLEIWFRLFINKEPEKSAPKLSLHELLQEI